MDLQMKFIFLLPDSLKMSTCHVSRQKNTTQELVYSFFIYSSIKLLLFLEKFEDLKIVLGGFLHP